MFAERDTIWIDPTCLSSACPRLRAQPEQQSSCHRHAIGRAPGRAPGSAVHMCSGRWNRAELLSEVHTPSPCPRSMQGSSFQRCAHGMGGLFRLLGLRAGPVGAHPLKALSGGECATNSVSIAKRVPGAGRSSSPRGRNVDGFKRVAEACIARIFLHTCHARTGIIKTALRNPRVICMVTQCRCPMTHIAPMHRSHS